jgi:RNA polymerase sigma factor (sigma-70 family)
MGNDRVGRRKAYGAAPATDLATSSVRTSGGIAQPLPAQIRGRFTLLYHFCRLQMPAIRLNIATSQRHLERAFEVFRIKPGIEAMWGHFLDSLYPLDWFLASACLDGIERAWDTLFSARAGRSDCLLVDALRARAARLYPRDEEKQESAVNEFWGHLLIAEHDGSVPVLERYDGQRPLVPWLIRVFQNWHISQLRRHTGIRALPDDDLALPLPDSEGDQRWHEAFCEAARECLSHLKDNEVLILGLRLRYRLSQREAAAVLDKHEGNLSRQTDQLRDKCMECIGQRLVAQGWTGSDLSEYVLTEMPGVLLDDPRMSVDQLARLLGEKGRRIKEPRKK